MRGKKIGIIIIIIFFVVAVLGGIFAYLFLATDTFKGNKQIFLKYLSQTVEQVEEVKNSKILENYKDRLNLDKYETNTSVDFKYSEGGEVSSGYNNLSINMQTQKDEQYNYKKAQILFGDKSIVQVEGIRSENLDGIRFTDIFNQFVTLQDGKNINGLNLTDENLIMMKNIIEDNQEFYEEILFTNQDYESLKEKYLNIIGNALNDGTYTKQKNSIITINSQTVKSTAYSCQLNGMQVQNLVIKLLNTLKSDDIILNKVNNILNDTKKYEDYITELLRNAEDTEFSNIKVTVYAQNGNIIRTALNIGTDNITIEKTLKNNKYILKIQHEQLNSEKENSQEIIISRTSTDENEEYIFNIEVVDGEDKYSIDATVSSDYKTTMIDFDFYKDIVNINIKAKDIMTDTLSQRIDLQSNNNIVLNNLSDELLKVVVDKMNSAYTDTLLKRYDLLIKKLKSEDLMSALKSILSDGNFDEDDQTSEPSTPAENQITKEEINRFNAKFEFYSGTNISGDSVKVLLDVVKDNLKSVDIIPMQTVSTSTDKVKEKIKLNIKKDNENADLANGITEKINAQDKYDVTIEYNKDSGITEAIIIVPSDK